MGETLTFMQERYLWLAGSYPNLLLVQGRGKRSARLLYAIDDDELIVFGYSSPGMFLVNRGLLRRGQMLGSYVLTDEGEAEFRRLVATGAGLRINPGLRKVEIVKRSP